MQKFTLLMGPRRPMDRGTSTPTPSSPEKQFLKSIKKTGFGPNLFDEWRYLDKGEPGIPESQRKPNPDFVLNQPRYQGASILLARRTWLRLQPRARALGAGPVWLSRHHRAQLCRHLLQQLLQERLLPIVLPEATVAQLFDEAAPSPATSSPSIWSARSSCAHRDGKRSRSRCRLSANTACSTALTTSA